MPAQTRFASAHGMANNYFGTRAEQDANAKAVRPGGLFGGCFGCGASPRDVADAPTHKQHSSSMDSSRDGKEAPVVQPSGITDDASAAGKAATTTAPEGPAAPTTPRGASTAGAEPAGDRSSSSVPYVPPPEGADSGNNGAALFHKPGEPTLAAERPVSVSGTQTPRTSSPSGPVGSPAGVFSSWLRPKSRGSTSAVTPVEDTADEVSPLPSPGPGVGAGAAPDAHAPSASGSPGRSPRHSDGARRASGTGAAAPDADEASGGAGGYRMTPAGGALMQRLVAGLAEQHPGMVTIASFKDNDSSQAAAGGHGGTHMPAPGLIPTRGSLADVAMGAPGGEAVGTPPRELEPRPAFLRRGASCSGAEPPPASSIGGFLMAAGGSATPLSVVKGSMARRSSYAGGEVTVSSVHNDSQPLEQPLSDGGAAVPYKPSPSLRAKPLSTPPAQQPQPLLQPSSSLLRPSPLLQQSPSLLRQPPPGQQKLMLQSPSLLRDPAAAAAGGAVGSGGGSEQQLRLPPPQPALRHNGCSFSRNVSTTTAVAALGALRPLGSMARHGALAPIATGPSPEEAAAALSRLQSLQALHRQRTLQRQQPQRGQEGEEEGAAAAAPPAPQADATSPRPAAEAADAAEANKPSARPAELPLKQAFELRAGPGSVNGVFPPPTIPEGAEEGSDADSDADSVVGDLPPPPATRRQPPAAAVAGSGSSALHDPESMQPMRRAASDEPAAIGKAPGGGVGGSSDLTRTMALSDVGSAGGAASAGSSGPTATVSADPRVGVADGSQAHAAKWFDALQPPGPGQRRSSPEPIKPMPEPELSAGSLASRSSAAQSRGSAGVRGSAGAKPLPLAGRVAALRGGAGDKPNPAATDSYKHLLQEIEP